MQFEFKQFLNGEWLDASNGNTWDVINPATEETIVTVPFGNADDCRQAIEAAEAAFPAWSTQTPYQRADVLKKAAALILENVSELATISTQESGKPLSESKGEWFNAAEMFEWFAEECKRAYGRVIPSRNPYSRLLTIRQPIGVVGAITAWNFPAYNPARSWSAALAAGCTLVARPSEYTPLSAMAMTQILAEAGLPNGVINLINGEPDTMGQEMLSNPMLRKISFTGSTRVGRILMEGAAQTFTRLSLELGGNAPVIIMADANIDIVAKTAASTKFYNNGQMCTAPQRFLVHESVVDEYVEKVTARVQTFKVGNGLEKGVRIGPMINAKQLARLEELVASAQGELVMGGSRPVEMDKGYFYQPTIMTDVAPDSRLYQEEIFGPVMPITTFSEFDEAIALANNTDYGLMGFVWTNDLNTAIHAYEKLEFGMVGINEWFPQSTEAPFGGWKQSGIGKELGQEGLDDYLETKLVALGGLR